MRSLANRRGLPARLDRRPSRDTFSNTDGFHIVVYELGDGSWAGKITDLDNGHVISSRKRYADADKAKLAAFDGMVFLKGKGDRTGGSDGG